jgi:hypothetical protein
VIAERWKHLPVAGRAFYRQVANADKEKYDRFFPPQDRQRNRQVSSINDYSLDKKVNESNGKQLNRIETGPSLVAFLS